MEEQNNISAHPTNPAISTKNKWSWFTVILFTILALLVTVLLGNFILQNYFPGQPSASPQTTNF